MMRLDISRGVEPVKMFRDFPLYEYRCWIENREYVFASPLPFTLKDGCADRALVEKHG